MTGVADRVYLDRIVLEVDQWSTNVEASARALLAKLEHQRSASDVYHKLLLRVRLRGNSLEISWQIGHIKGPGGLRPKRKMWFVPLRKMPARQGNGYHMHQLFTLSHLHERALIQQIELEARELRAEQAQIMTMRAALRKAGVGGIRIATGRRLITSSFCE